MFRKLFAVLTLVLALPAFANAAWTVKASSANPTYGTVTPSGYNYYADSDQAAKTFTVTPGGNYQVASILVDNVEKMSGTGTQTVTVPYKLGTTIVVAKFAAKQFSVTAGAVTGNGSITSLTPSLVNAGASKTFTIAPNAGNKILSIKDNNVDQTVTNAAGMTYTVSNVQANHVITATFGGVTANAGVMQNAIKNTTVTLNGSGTDAFGTPTYKWTVVYAPSGSGLVAGQQIASTAVATFTPTAVGAYNFKLTVADTANPAAAASSATTVNAFDDYKAAALATVNSCIVCHAPQAEFTQSYHWNNHLEVGPEFTGGAVEGQLNANESWTTYENGTLTTCSGRCHFKSKTNAVGCNTCHASGQFNGSTLRNTSVLGMDAPLPNTVSTCLVCHSGSKHGKVPNEFFASKHWQNNFEYGDEFANQTDVTVNGGVVTPTGTKSAGYLNANDSYTTTENGGVVTCAYRCHFRPGQGPNQNYGTYLKDGKSTTYVSYTDTTGKYGPAGKVYSRPGGNSCMACHDPHGLEATAQSTCYTCHAGSVTSHAWSVAAFEKSTHFTGYWAKMEGVANESCIGCHDAHGLEAGFADMTTATKLHTAAAATGCQKCHTPGVSYGIFSSNLIGKAPHFSTTGTTGFAYVQDMADPNNTASCADCHYHNNAPNAGWAEGGHGKLASPWNRLSATDKTINLKTSPWVGGNACARCHSAKGYAYFVNSSFQSMSTVNAVVKTNETTGLAYSTYSPLTCNGCHIPKSPATPLMLQGKLRASNSSTFTGYYGISTARNYFTANVVDSLTYTNNKNSNGCMPCHSPRGAVGQNIKSAFAVAGPDAKLAAGNFGAHHGDLVGPVFWGMGGYDFTVQNGTSNNEFAYQDRARHQRIGNYGTATAGYNNTGITQGSCVGCHYASDAPHSLEITAESFENSCYKCHPTDFTTANVAAAAADNAAALKALSNLLTLKAFQATGTGIGNGTDMSFNAAGVLTGDNVVAEKNIGANFNYSVLTAGDAAAYAHNPSYARRLINDSIDWLDDNLMNGSAALTIEKNLASVTYNGTTKTVTALTAAEVTAAAGRLNNPGCMGCHFGTGSTNEEGAVPGVEQMPHFNDGTAKTSEGLNSAQFVVAGAQCNNCHGYGHGTDSPSYSAAKASFPNISAVQGEGILKNYAESAHGEVNGLAWSHYDFKQADRADCTVCHTTKGFISGVENANANGGKVTAVAVWGTTADTTKQVLGCNACHSSTSWKTSVRSINGGYVASMGGWNKAQALTFGDVGESNVCIPCHASRENGDSIKANVLVANTGGFKNPHYLAAAATFYGKGGFRFYGATDTPAVNVTNANGTFSGNVPAYNTEYGVVNDGIISTTTAVPLGSQLLGRNATWSHGKIGMDNYTTSSTTTGTYAGKVRGSGNKGQCVACHLGPTNTHTFNAYEVANATMGTSTSKGCFGCHNGEDMEEVGDTEELPLFKRMMAFFQWNLQQKGLYYNAAKNPYFFTDATFTTNFTSWGATLDATQKTMGAAQNFKLLDAEKGAHVHNRSYMRQLVFDSIQYLQFGAVTYSNSKFYGTTGSENLEDVLKFSAYSSALAAAPDQIKNPNGSMVSINQLKGYIISSSSRTNPIDLTTGQVPPSATYGAIKFFRR